MTLRIHTIPKIRHLTSAKTRYRVAYGGRGSGKSYGVAQTMMGNALTEKCRILCTRDTQNTLSDSALAILKRVIKDHNVEDAFKATQHGLMCDTTGAEFIFRGLQNPDRIKSLDGVKYCWVEEGQRVSQAAWNALIPTIRDPDSQIWVIFNPDQKTDPVYRTFIADGGRPDATVEKINYTDNKYFEGTSLVSEMEYDRDTDPDKFQHIWKGETRQISDALVFKGKYRLAVFETPQDVDRFYYGADWGFSQDPSCLIRMFIKNQVLWIDHEAYGVGVDIDNLPNLFDIVPGVRTWPITGDSQRPDTMSYLRKQGFKVYGAKKGKGSVEDGVAFIRSFRGVVIHPRCKHTADEFGLYSYKVDKLTEDILPILEDKHNHCIDSIRYALEATMHASGSVGKLGAGEIGL